MKSIINRMWRRPMRTCNGQIPNSKIQAIPTNLYRAGLGVGMSPSVKKCPQRSYRPGVGYVQIQCYPPPITVINNGNFLSGSDLDGGDPSSRGSVVADGGNPQSSGSQIISGGNPGLSNNVNGGSPDSIGGIIYDGGNPVSSGPRILNGGNPGSLNFVNGGTPNSVGTIGYNGGNPWSSGSQIINGGTPSSG
jgi:hypothetical protein